VYELLVAFELGMLFMATIVVFALHKAMHGTYRIKKENFPLTKKFIEKYNIQLEWKKE